MLQIIEQSREEKEKMYMKCTKKQLISMLIESNALLGFYQNENSYYHIPSDFVDIGKCDICGCHPNYIIQTEYGRFCKEHVKY
jgi:hypothetical protein